jgi:hypothetical protein
MTLVMTNNYIDSRFRTSNSNSEYDFSIELPRSFNVPDGVVAHIDDIVLPVSWKTIDERNNMCTVLFACGTAVRESTFTFDSRNYDGEKFATALADKLNTAVLGFMVGGVPVVPTMTCACNTLENILTISLVDTSRNEASRGLYPFQVVLYTDDMIAFTNKSAANSINTIIRNNTPQTIISQTTPYTCYLDLFQTRNLYLTSPALASYDTVSNLGLDTIIKKMPCTAGCNRLLTQSSGSALDGLDVSKRPLRVIDFKIVDSSFRTVLLQGNHFSFSILFAQKK